MDGKLRINKWLVNERQSNVKEEYNNLVNESLIGQIFIPNRNIKSTRNDLKWMTDRLKHMIGIKRGMYKQIKNRETELKEKYTALARTVRKEI